MSRLTSITGIARIIDPRLRTHQFHLAVAALGGLIVMAVELEQQGSIDEGPRAGRQRGDHRIPGLGYCPRG